MHISRFGVCAFMLVGKQEPVGPMYSVAYEDKSESLKCMCLLQTNYSNRTRIWLNDYMYRTRDEVTKRLSIQCFQSDFVS